MAVTETPPETAEAVSETAASAPRPQPTGLAGVLGSGDHKVIGRLYIVSSLLMGLLIVVLGEGFAVESAIKPSTLQVFTNDVAFQLFTLFRVGSIFLLALPLVIGVALVVVPLQVGARTVAFPRAAAASYWGWLMGAGLLLGSYAANGGPGGGSASAVNLWIAAMGVLVLSVLLAAVCLATTVFALRTTGLTMERTPLFAWSIAVASVMWLLTLPILFGQLILMYVDHRHAGSVAFAGTIDLYLGLAWLLRNPQIYVVAIPVLGFVADVLITTSGARFRGRSAAQGAIGAFGALSFGAFLVAPSETALESPIVIAFGLLAVLPVLVVVLSLADLFRKGSFKLNAGVLYAVSSLLVLLLGVSAGALGSIPNVLEIPEGGSANGNIFFFGVGTAVLLAAVIASLGGIHWWATKVGYRPAGEKLGMAAPLLLLIGAAAATIPDLISGIAGSGNETVADFTGGIAGLNAITAGGVALVALAIGLSLLSFLPLLKPADDTPADPWGGQSLEWLTASPPSLGNFDDEIAVVTSAEPLIDLREEK